MLDGAASKRGRLSRDADEANTSGQRTEIKTN